MVSMERFRDIMDEIIVGLPKEILSGVNGGILLEEEEKIHAESACKDLFIMGEYRRDRYMGRCIFIYYGSFMRVHGNLTEEALINKIRKTLLHELRHHLESLAGERDLDIEDAMRLAEYKERKNDSN